MIFLLNLGQCSVSILIFTDVAGPVVRMLVLAPSFCGRTRRKLVKCRVRRSTSRLDSLWILVPWPNQTLQNTV